MSTVADRTSWALQDSTNVSLYDPVFTGADQELFRLLGMQCVNDKEALLVGCCSDWNWADICTDRAAFAALSNHILHATLRSETVRDRASRKLVPPALVQHGVSGEQFR